MDLAIYINELLGLKGEVSVPGIGFFEQKRVSGYYNEREKKFYPPRHEVVFDPQPKEDEGLANYISAKKNISPASAKYFIDKYATGLKARASEQKVDINGLGHLFYEYSVLSFKADKSHDATDPSFFGLAPVKAESTKGGSKVVEKPPVKTEPPVDTQATPEPVKTETVVEEKAVFTDTRNYIPQEVYEEEEGTGRGRVWVIGLLGLIILLLGFGVLYQYKPTWFGRKEMADTTIIIRSAPPAVKPADTAKTTAVKDTTAPGLSTVGTIKPPVDTFAVRRYEIQAGARRTVKAAGSLMDKYSKLGLHPRIMSHVSGVNRYKITLGTYFNESDANKAEDSIMKATKLTSNDIYVQPYNPIKK